MALTVNVEVPPRDREVLASWVRSPSIRAGLAQRARIVLLAGDGIGTNEIARRTGASKPTVILWKKRYAAEGTGGLAGGPAEAGHVRIVGQGKAVPQPRGAGDGDGLISRLIYPGASRSVDVGQVERTWNPEKNLCGRRPPATNASG